VESFCGAEWVHPPKGPPVLLLASQLVSGGQWRYTYSIAPGVTVSVITRPGPGAAGPRSPIMAQAINDITGRTPP
jgi:hypothetical protein